MKSLLLAGAILALTACSQQPSTPEPADEQAAPAVTGDTMLVREFGGEAALTHQEQVVDTEPFKDSPNLVYQALGDDDCTWDEDAWEYDINGARYPSECPGDDMGLQTLWIRVYPSAEDAQQWLDSPENPEWYAYRAGNVTIGSLDRDALEDAVDTLRTSP